MPLHETEEIQETPEASEVEAAKGGCTSDFYDELSDLIATAMQATGDQVTRADWYVLSAARQIVWDRSATIRFGRVL